MNHNEISRWMKCMLLTLSLTFSITGSYALSLIMTSNISLIKRSSSNPVGWRGEWFTVSLSETSAPPISGSDDWYKSEGQPTWIEFHSRNRSWTGLVPSEGPDVETLQFRLIGNVQNREILQPVNITLMTRPTRSFLSSSATTILPPEFLIPNSLPINEMVTQAPSVLSKQLSPVFLPWVNVIDTELADMVQLPDESESTIQVTEILTTYDQDVQWTTPSKSVQWKPTPGSIPSWLKFDAEVGLLSGTVPKASMMIEAREFKRDAIQISFVAESQTSPGDNSGPRPTQVIVIRPKSQNTRPQFQGQNSSNNATAISTKDVVSGSPLEWTLSQPINDTDGDAVTWMCTQSALGLPPWVRWDAKTATMRGTVPSRNNGTLNNAMLIDWTKVSLPLRGSMPQGKPWSPSSSFWVTAMDPLGGLADWKRADLLVDQKKPPIPLRPILDIPKSNDTTSTISVKLNDLFDTPIESVFEWPGFVGVLPANQPITLDQNGALIVDQLGRSQEVLAHIILVDSDGATGVATVYFPKQVGDEFSGPALTVQYREMESDSSSLSFKSIMAIVVCLIALFLVALWVAARKRQIKRNRDILNQIRNLGLQRRPPSVYESTDSGSITMIATEPANSAKFYQDANPLKLSYYKHKLDYSDDVKSSLFSTLDSIQLCHESLEVEVNDKLNEFSLNPQENGDFAHSQSFEISSRQEYPLSISTPNQSGFAKSLPVIPEADTTNSPITSSATPKYVNKIETGSHETMQRTHIGDTSISVEPPADMPHIDVISGEPLSYLHPNVWQDYQSNSNQLGGVRYGLVSGHFRKQVPRWISIDPITGGLSGIPTENEVNMANVLAIVRWEVSTHDKYPVPDIPIDAVEIARIWVNVSNSSELGNRDTVIDHEVERSSTPPPPIPFRAMSAVSELVAKFNIKTSIYQSSSSRTTEIMQSTRTTQFMDNTPRTSNMISNTNMLRKLLLESNMPMTENQNNVTALQNDTFGHYAPKRILRRRSSCGVVKPGFLNDNQHMKSHCTYQKRRSSYDNYQLNSHTSTINTEALDSVRFNAWLRNSMAARDTMEFELHRL